MANAFPSSKKKNEESDIEREELYDSHRSELFDIIYQYVDEEEVDEHIIMCILLDLLVTIRMNSYASNSKALTSSGGRKDLDKLISEFLAVVEEAKNGMDSFVASWKTSKEAGNDDDDDDDL